ncbi:unnamed protein product [Microthlaspi erraticum]|uniref:F-box domain-containing protein n=1 Tax=Microthlaspi erraticum TaxID=1685480 RepID=A0A6D2L7W0_9BRAS|nr:unnamed protein product [Microthlaspi erraticum]
MLDVLPEDLVREILSRVPVTCLVRLRSTCKQWNNLIKDPEFIITNQSRNSAAGEKQSMIVLLKQVGVYEFLTSKLVKLKDRLYDSDKFYIYDIYYCDGLLLCTIVNKIRNDDEQFVSRLVVWNPILGQTKWIDLTNRYRVYDIFTLGHDGNKNYKILRIFYGDSSYKRGLEIYDCKVNSWKSLDEDVTRDDWGILARGASLNGDSYWIGYDESDKDVPMLISFDFSVEKLQRQFLPNHQSEGILMALSVHREEELLLLNQGYDTLKTEIWVTTNNKMDKKKTKVFSWSKYLTVDLYSHNISLFHYTSFFIMEEKKKTLVCCCTRRYLSYYKAYVIGEEENGVRKVHLGKFDFRVRPLMFNYLPSLVQIH